MASSSTKDYYIELALTAGGGTHTLDSELPFTVYKVTGTVTLLANWVIQASNMGVGQRFILKYEAVLDLNGSTLTIFGKTIDQGLADRDFYVDAIYDGSAWNTSILLSFDNLPAISTSMIEDDAITTSKIADGDVTNDKLDTDSVDTSNIVDDAVETTKIADNAVTVDKLSDDLLVETIVVPVSFESGEQCNNDFIIDYDCNITSVSACVTKAIAGTDNATITLEIGGNPSTPSVITFTASDPLNTVESITPATNNDVTAGDTISLITAKTTAGGKALVSIKLVRS